MERLTPERGERTWRLYRMAWYVTLLCFIAVMLGGMFFMYMLLSGASDASDTATFDSLVMVGLFLGGGLILIGAGVTRYQARLEGQHLELKIAINRLQDAVENLRKKENI